VIFSWTQVGEAEAQRFGAIVNWTYPRTTPAESALNPHAGAAHKENLITKSPTLATINKTATSAAELFADAVRRRHRLQATERLDTSS
jgi:hypothetical protein